MICKAGKQLDFSKRDFEIRAVRTDVEIGPTGRAPTVRVSTCDCYAGVLNTGLNDKQIIYFTTQVESRNIN